MFRQICSYTLWALGCLGVLVAMPVAAQSLPKLSYGSVQIRFEQPVVDGDTWNYLEVSSRLGYRPSQRLGVELDVGIGYAWNDPQSVNNHYMGVHGYFYQREDRQIGLYAIHNSFQNNDSAGYSTNSIGVEALADLGTGSSVEAYLGRTYYGDGPEEDLLSWGVGVSHPLTNQFSAQVTYRSDWLQETEQDANSLRLGLSYQVERALNIGSGPILGIEAERLSSPTGSNTGLGFSVTIPVGAEIQTPRLFSPVRTVSPVFQF